LQQDEEACGYAWCMLGLLQRAGACSGSGKTLHCSKQPSSACSAAAGSTCYMFARHQYRPAHVVLFPR
jgi:hypothetical protein